MIRTTIIGACLFMSSQALAISSFSLQVEDIKTGKVKTRITMPLWIAKIGSSMAAVMKGNDSNVDIGEIVKLLSEKKEAGTFLKIEDYESGERVFFEVN